MAICLSLSEQEMLNSNIELLIKNLGAQRATAQIMIELLCEGNEQKANEFTGMFNDLVDENAKRIWECLYERRGQISIDEILGT